MPPAWSLGLPALSYVDAKELIARLVHAARPVLVGGQAVNFWAEYYLARGRCPTLEPDAPFTSKDVDFYVSTADEARRIALALGGQLHLATELDHTTPNAGIVLYRDARGVERRLDLLRMIYGMREEEIERLRLPIELEDEQGCATGKTFFVLPPFLCLESRVCNLMGLPGYDTPQHHKQLRAMIVCTREYLRDLLENGRADDVLRLNERIFRFATRSREGKAVYRQHGIDVMQAVLIDDRLPKKFLERRWPQMQLLLASRRAPG